MSNNDSFIDEVSEEVRRDRLFGLLRRYGWIAIVLVVALVGGAAFFEYQRAQERAQAEAFGDAIVAALAEDDPDARRDALLEIDADDTRAALLAMLAADRLEDDASRETTRDTLNDVAETGELPQIYRDLAVLKSVMIAQDDADPEDLRARLEPLTIPGAPFRLLALEQMALLDVSAGNTDAALETLTGILSDDAVMRDLRQRAQQLIVALGGSLDIG